MAQPVSRGQERRTRHPALSPGLEISPCRRLPGLLNRPATGQSCMGAGCRGPRNRGRCLSEFSTEKVPRLRGPVQQDLERPAVRALLTGTRSRCPQVPSADTRLTLLQSPPRHSTAAPGSPEARAPAQNAPRDTPRFPPVGTAAHCRGVRWQQSCPPFLSWPLAATVRRRVNTSPTEPNRAGREGRIVEQLEWDWEETVGLPRSRWNSVQIRGGVLIIRVVTFVLFQKVQFQGHFFFFFTENEPAQTI